MKVYIGILVIILSSCVSKQSFEDKYSLIPTDNYCEFRIDDDTRIPLFNLYVQVILCVKIIVMIG